MKNIFTNSILFYQKIANPVLHSLFGGQRFCRFEISCSDYAIRAVSQYGAIRGGRMTISRIAHCHPFASNTIKYESI